MDTRRKSHETALTFACRYYSLIQSYDSLIRLSSAPTLVLTHTSSVSALQHVHLLSDTRVLKGGGREGVNGERKEAGRGETERGGRRENMRTPTQRDIHRGRMRAHAHRQTRKKEVEGGREG